MVRLQKKKKRAWAWITASILSTHKQFRSGKLPHSIDSDNKWHCPSNICFRLPHWYCGWALGLSWSSQIAEPQRNWKSLVRRGFIIGTQENFIIMLGSCVSFEILNRGYVSTLNHAEDYFWREGRKKNASCLLCPWIEVPIQSSYNVLTQTQLKTGLFFKDVTVEISFLLNLRMEYQRFSKPTW